MEAKSFLATQGCTKGGHVINVTQPELLPVERHCRLDRPLKDSFIPVACKLDISTIRLVRDHLKMFTLFFCSYRGLFPCFPHHLSQTSDSH